MEEREMGLDVDEMETEMGIGYRFDGGEWQSQAPLPALLAYLLLWQAWHPSSMGMLAEFGSCDNRMFQEKG